MNPDIEEALTHDRTVDITTTGRRSGRPRRLEIWFHNLGSGIYISGLPGRRGWYANLLEHPDFTFHLKESTQADLAARAQPVTEPGQRAVVLGELLPKLGRMGDYDDWIAGSPIVKVEFLGAE